MHPAIIAQAAATSATLLPNRFFLGVGTGENLNEHIIGVRWPNHEIRREMLKEGVEIIRELWKGKRTNYLGKYYTVENAKIYTLPPQNPPIIIAVEGKEIAKLASTIGDGMISTTLNPELIDLFNIDKVNDNRPLYCQITVCYAPSEREAREIVFKQWPINALPSDLNWEIQSTELFEKAVSVVSEEQATANIACGPDLAKQAQAINEAVEAGFRKISIHNIGPFQEEFFKFYKNQVIPNLMFLKEEIC